MTSITMNDTNPLLVKYVCRGPCIVETEALNEMYKSISGQLIVHLDIYLYVYVGDIHQSYVLCAST